MALGAPVRRRQVRIRGGSLGPVLCWAVVFADIGTSIYYTPAILYSTVGKLATLFVLMTLVVFVLLTLKYAEVAWRYPEGGGVVTVATRAIHPFAGLLGGLFIQVDYFLTAALSALSGFLYLAVVIPALQPVVLEVTVAALAVLGLLNYLGIKESARVSAIFAVAAGSLQLLVVLVVAVQIGPAGIVDTAGQVFSGPKLTPIGVLTGYAGAFLAFSGLESISQLSPAMREPRRPVSERALLLVVGTMLVTSPLLTLWSTTLLKVTDANSGQLLSLLGLRFGGAAIGDAVAVSGSLLLVFASNTAIIGSYHVFLALSRMGFLPDLLQRRNRLRGTPHWAIAVTVGVPILVVVLANGNQNLLGDLYAFGLLGAFTMTALSLDIVRWHDRDSRATLRARAGYWVGVLTTVLVALGWVVNLFAKPLATAFGGALTLLGLGIALVNVRIGQHRGRPLVLPFLLQPNRKIVPISIARALKPADVLAILPHDPELLDPVIRSTIKAAAGRPTVFLYRGHRHQRQAAEPALLEVRDPYLDDRNAQRAFARAEILARDSIPDRRIVYVPAAYAGAELVDYWKTLNPHEVVVADADRLQLPTTAVDRVRRLYEDEVPILHLISGRLSHLKQAR